MEDKPKVIAIVGPTASGKSGLAIAVAKEFGGEVVSADSRQVYRGLDIGSGKVTSEEMGGVPHHLLDVADPCETYTAAGFVRDGRKAVAEIASRGNTPIIAGGTFFYLDALLGRVSLPEVSPNQELRAQLEQQTIEELFAELSRVDPRRAADIDSKNKVRLVRALEIVAARGAVPEAARRDSLYNVLTIGIDISREELHYNIHTRLHTRLDAGMIEEVALLHKRGVSWERLESFGLEYRNIAEYLQEKTTREEMCETLEREIRKFAKRQRTWLKRDKTIHWFPCAAHSEIFATIRAFLGAAR